MKLAWLIGEQGKHDSSSHSWTEISQYWSLIIDYIKPPIIIKTTTKSPKDYTYWTNGKRKLSTGWTDLCPITKGSQLIMCAAIMIIVYQERAWTWILELQLSAYLQRYRWQRMLAWQKVDNQVTTVERSFEFRTSNLWSSFSKCYLVSHLKMVLSGNLLISET